MCTSVDSSPSASPVADDHLSDEDAVPAPPPPLTFTFRPVSFPAAREDEFFSVHEDDATSARVLPSRDAPHSDYFESITARYPFNMTHFADFELGNFLFDLTQKYLHLPEFRDAPDEILKGRIETAAINLLFERPSAKYLEKHKRNATAVLKQLFPSLIFLYHKCLTEDLRSIPLYPFPSFEGPIFDYIEPLAEYYKDEVQRTFNIGLFIFSVLDYLYRQAQLPSMDEYAITRLILKPILKIIFRDGGFNTAKATILSLLPQIIKPIREHMIEKSRTRVTSSGCCIMC
jgi:hypothetical protein